MRRSSYLMVFCFLILAGCGSSSTVGAPNPASPVVRPQVRQSGHNPVQWTKVAIRAARSGPLDDVAVGPNQSVWFTDAHDGIIGRSTMNGGVLTYSPPGMTPRMLAVGKHQLLYFDQCTSQIVAMTSGGAATSYEIPSGSIACGALAEGSDGNVWFVEAGHVAKITPVGKIVEFKFTDSTADGLGIATGPDDALWFTEQGVNAVHRIDPLSHVITNYDLSSVGACDPVGITSASDGNVWFGCASVASIGRVSTSGTAALFHVPFMIDGLKSIGQGPDGNPWFVSGTSGAVAEFDPSTGNTTVYVSPYSSGSSSFTSGPDGNVWSASARQLSIYIRLVLTATPTSLTFFGLNQTNYIDTTETGNPTLDAVSSNVNVAYVGHSSPPGTFFVNSIGTGTCTVTIFDSVGNSFRIPVSVQ